MNTSILRKISVGMIGIILMLSCFYAGTNVEEKLLAVSNEETETIAVVNLDEGTYKQSRPDEIIYYSNELLKYNHTDFEVVSLESARNGILEGRFGAYVILPADFSEKIESVNYDPEKAALTYAVNPYLNSSAKERVMKDLESFNADINYDISYMYVSAVLNEFHDVQDSSKVVLSNDLSDEEELLAVDAEQLFEVFSYPELLQVEKEIEDLDFQEIFETNRSLGSDIKEGLDKDLEESRLAYQEIQNQSTEVFGATDNVLLVIENYLPGYDEHGQLVYQDGISSISENFARYDQERSESVREIKRLARNEADRIGAVAVDREITKIQNSVSGNYMEKEALWEYQTAVNGEIEKYFIYINARLKTLGVSDNDLPDYGVLSISMNAIPEPDSVEINIRKYAGSISQNDIRRLTEDQDLSKEFCTAVDEAATVSSNDIMEIIDEEVVGELVKQQKNANRLIGDQKKELEKKIRLYDEAIAEFDPYEYIDEDRIEERLEKFKENVDRIETEQGEHDEDYWELMKEIYEVTGSNQEAFDENLKESQEITRTNVESTIALLKENKSATTKENKELLEAFTKKLAYTRLGSLGKIEAYDFIVSPVEFNENRVEQTILEIQSNYQNYVLIAMAVLGILAVFSFMLSIAFKSREKADAEGEDNFS